MTHRLTQRNKAQGDARPVSGRFNLGNVRVSRLGMIVEKNLFCDERCDVLRLNSQSAIAIQNE